MVHGHHGGLRQNYLPARTAVESDMRDGWVSKGRRDLLAVGDGGAPRQLLRDLVRRGSKYRLTLLRLQLAEGGGKLTPRGSHCELGGRGKGREV